MIRYLCDENTHGALPEAISRCASWFGATPVDVMRVGDAGAPAHGTPDPDLLRWAADHRQILVSGDYQTMPGYLTDIRATGRSSPGVLLIRQGRSLGEIAESLVTIAHAAAPDEYADRVAWIPL